MNLDKISSFFDGIKRHVSLYTVMVVFVFSTSYLLGYLDEIMGKGLFAYLNKYRYYVYGVSIVSGLLVAGVFLKHADGVSRKVVIWVQQRLNKLVLYFRFHRHCKDISDLQRQCLREFMFMPDDPWVYLPKYNAQVIWLVDKGFIECDKYSHYSQRKFNDVYFDKYKLTSLGRGVMYNEYLGIDSNMNQEELQYFMINNRPYFASWYGYSQYYLR